MAKVIEGNVPSFSGDFLAQINAQYEWLGEKEAAALDSDTLLGYVMGEQIADGNAWYEVVSLKPFTIAFLRIGDGYRMKAPWERGVTAKDFADHKAMMKRRREYKVFGR